MNTYSSRMRDGNKNRDFIDAFGGFNHNMRINENEFYDIENMSSSNYPLLSSRGTFMDIEAASSQLIKGICCNAEKIWFVYVDSGDLMIDYKGRSSSDTDYPVNLGAIDTRIFYRSDEERTLVNFGSYIIVFPDKFYFNTADITDYGSMEKVFRNIDADEHYNKWYVVKPCDIDGNEYVADSYSSAEPNTDNIADGYVWYDKSEKVIKVWSASYSMWTTPVIYHKYRIEGIGVFKEGDGVKIRRYHDNEEYSATTTIVKAYSSGKAPSGEEVPPLDADYIIIPSADDMKIHWRQWGNRGVLYNQWRNQLSVEQKTPTLDYVCECQGRLWGCRYGDTETSELKQYRKSYGTSFGSVQYIDIIAELGNGETFGEFLTYWAYNDSFERKDRENGVTVSIVTGGAPEGTHYPCIKVEVDGYTDALNVNVNYTINKTKKLNEIYASRQQDFKSWDYFQGTALDSYTVSIGASGNFTGAINFNGKPLFSKEDRIYILYGDYTPYKLQENIFEGVEQDANKTMVVYNGVLYYKGKHGIYAYNGGLPQRIDTFGDLIFKPQQFSFENYFARTQCAAAYNGVYYFYALSLNSGSRKGKSGLYTYDISRGIWHRNVTVGLVVQAISFADEEDGTTGVKALVYKSPSVSEQHTYLRDIETDGGEIAYDSWYAETGELGLSSPDEKYCSKITVRYKGSATIKINYDSETDAGTGEVVWNTVASVEGGTKSQTVTINPKRCDHFRLRFEGEGEFYLYSIAKTVETGSDVNNG